MYRPTSFKIPNPRKPKLKSFANSFGNEIKVIWQSKLTRTDTSLFLFFIYPTKCEYSYFSYRNIDVFDQGVLPRPQWEMLVIYSICTFLLWNLNSLNHVGSKAVRGQLMNPYHSDPQIHPLIRSSVALTWNPDAIAQVEDQPQNEFPPNSMRLGSASPAQKVARMSLIY